MFTTENVIENTQNESEVKDFEPKTVEHFLNFLYSDQLDRPAGYNSLQLLLMADKYNVVGLKKECEKALAKSITVSNAISVLTTASRIQAELLVEKSAKFIFENLDKFEGSTEWNEMVKTHPENLDHILKQRS